MSTVTILDTPQITMWYHPEKKIVHHQMHKYTFGPTFRDALMKGVEIMQKNRARKWLSDDRLNPVLKPEDNEWAISDWAPKVIAVGWKYWAIVLPESVINKMRMENNAKVFAEKGVTVQFFQDPDEALEWLESLP
jgi:hypothetical protein